MAKDLFSAQTSFYAKYRPTYPRELYAFIMGFITTKEVAWDCGTGNGQAACILSEYFKQVKATDISASQLSAVQLQDNIDYLLCPAEKTPFADRTFDLVTVAQAYHWFHFDAFGEEVKRVSKPGGVLAIWGYNLIVTLNDALNKAMLAFYTHIIGPFWDSERRYVEQNYETVPFGFPLITNKTFSIEYNWFKRDLIGYLNSWSAVQHFIKAENYNPVDRFAIELATIIREDELLPVSFPIFLKLGRVQ